MSFFRYVRTREKWKPLIGAATVAFDEWEINQEKHGCDCDSDSDCDCNCYDREEDEKDDNDEGTLRRTSAFRNWRDFTMPVRQRIKAFESGVRGPPPMADRLNNLHGLRPVFFYLRHLRGGLAPYNGKPACIVGHCGCKVHDLFDASCKDCRCQRNRFDVDILTNSLP